MGARQHAASESTGGWPHIDSAVRAAASRLSIEEASPIVLEVLARACSEGRVSLTAAAECARTLLVNGLLDEAGQIYQAFTLDRPDSSLGVTGQARVAMRRQNWRDALALWKEALEAFPAKREPGWLIGRATCLLEISGPTEGVFEAGRHAAKVYPEDPGAIALASRIATLRRDHRFALDLLRDRQACFNNNIPARVSAVEDSLAGADADLAVSIAAGAPADLSRTAEYRLQVLLRLCELTANEATGLKVLETITADDIDPESAGRIASFLIGARQSPRAVELLLAVVERAPGNRLVARAYLEAVFMAQGHEAFWTEWRRLLPNLGRESVRLMLRSFPIGALPPDNLEMLFVDALEMERTRSGPKYICGFLQVENPGFIPDHTERLSRCTRPSYRLVGRLLAARQAAAEQLALATDRQSLAAESRRSANALAKQVDSAIDAMIERQDGSDEFLNAIASLRRTVQRAGAAHINTRETYGDAAAFAEWFTARVRNRLPTSVIRLGDGEGNFLPYGPDCQAHQRWDRRLIQVQRWWGEEKLVGDIAEDISTRLRDCIARADAIGIVPVGRLMGFLHLDIVPGRTTRGLMAIRRYLDGEGADTLPTKLVTSWNISVDLEQWDLYGQMLKAASAVSVVSCHDLSGLLRDRFDIEVRRWFEAPEAKAYSAMFGRTANAAARDFYPDIFNEIMSEISPLPGEVYLVGAGILGKLICDQIRTRGGIALDIGSLADYWMGYTTRQHARFKPTGEELVTAGTAV